MKIVCAIEALDSDAGGPVSSARSLAVAQTRRGNEVKSSDQLSRKSTWSLAQINRLIAGRIDDRDIPRGLLKPYFARAACSARLAPGERSDVVPGYGMWRSVNIAACRAAFRAGRRFVITPHGKQDPRSLVQRPFRNLPMPALTWKNLLDKTPLLNALNISDANPLVPLGPAPDWRHVRFLSRLRNNVLNHLIENITRFTNSDCESDLVIAGAPEC